MGEIVRETNVCGDITRLRTLVFPATGQPTGRGRLAAGAADDVCGYRWFCSAGCQKRQPLTAWPVMALAAVLSEV